MPKKSEITFKTGIEETARSTSVGETDQETEI
jgi:hypothetical protein